LSVAAGVLDEACAEHSARHVHSIGNNRNC